MDVEQPNVAKWNRLIRNKNAYKTRKQFGLAWNDIKENYNNQ